MTSSNLSMATDASLDYFGLPQSTISKTKQQQQQNSPDISSPFLDDYLDFSGDSTYSPNSPMSASFDNAPCRMSMEGNWFGFPAGDKASFSPSVEDLLKQEPLEGLDLSSIALDPTSTSYVVGPNDLAGYSLDRAPFDGLVDFDTQDLFQTQQPAGGALSTVASSQGNKALTRAAMRPRVDTSGIMTGSSSSAQSRSEQPAYLQRKRKSSESASSGSASRSVSPPGSPVHKKVTHNMIEKRYRTNLNEKISALRNAVPSLRVMVNRLEQQNGDDAAVDDEHGQEDLGGLTPAQKLSKATILTKATEYIQHLEKKNKKAAWENNQLKARVARLEQIMLNSVGDFNAQANAAKF